MSRGRLFLSIVFLIAVLASFLTYRNAAQVEKTPISINPAQAEKDWTERIEKLGGKAAYAALADEIEGLSPASQHEMAHAFGAALFAVEDTRGLSVCDGRFSYGCFHEFLGRAISYHGLSVVGKLNQGCIDTLVESPLSCQHGIGHGILASLGYDDDSLEKALDECADLPYNDPIGGCYGGAFMEYNVQTMLGTEAHIRRPNSHKEIFEPCASLPDEYQIACAFWQPQWWHTAILNGAGSVEAFERLGEYCRDMTPTDQLRRTCFEGIGNITPPAADFDAAKAAKLCDATSDNARDRLYCRSLAANSLGGGGAGKKGDGRAVCADLIGEAYNYCTAYARNAANIAEPLQLRQ